MNTEWTVTLRRIEVRIPVGIDTHEKKPQRVWVDVTLKGSYAASPTDIAECIDYDFVHKYVTNQWPKRAHTPLLEQLVTDLIDAVFAHDAKVTYAKVAVMKPDIFKDVEAVGVETERRR